MGLRSPAAGAIGLTAVPDFGSVTGEGFDASGLMGLGASGAVMTGLTFTPGLGLSASTIPPLDTGMSFPAAAGSAAAALVVVVVVVVVEAALAAGVEAGSAALLLARRGDPTSCVPRAVYTATSSSAL